MKHSPTPWARGNHPAIINDAEGLLMAVLHNRHIMGNSALMLAAPELLASLKSLIPAAEQDLRDARALEHIAPGPVASKRAKLEAAQALVSRLS